MRLTTRNKKKLKRHDEIIKQRLKRDHPKIYRNWRKGVYTDPRRIDEIMGTSKDQQRQAKVELSRRGYRKTYEDVRWACGHKATIGHETTRLCYDCHLQKKKREDAWRPESVGHGILNGCLKTSMKMSPRPS